jgi:hypothetical protein
MDHRLSEALSAQNWRASIWRPIGASMNEIGAILGHRRLSTTPRASCLRRQLSLCRKRILGAPDRI